MVGQLGPPEERNSVKNASLSRFRVRRRTKNLVGGALKEKLFYRVGFSGQNLGFDGNVPPCPPGSNSPVSYCMCLDGSPTQLMIHRLAASASRQPQPPDSLSHSLQTAHCTLQFSCPPLPLRHDMSQKIKRLTYERPEPLVLFITDHSYH